MNGHWWRDRRVWTLLFVLSHGAFVVLLSIPPPPPGLRGDAPDPNSEAALLSWVSLAGAMGLPEQRTEQLLRGALPAWTIVLTSAQRPLRPYADLVGAQQSWRMFGVVPDHVASIEIDVKTGGRWVPLYRCPEPPDHAPQRLVILLRQERMRTLLQLFASRHSRSRWRALADVLGTYEERPLRLRMRDARIPDPQTLRETGLLQYGSAYWEEIR